MGANYSRIDKETKYFSFRIYPVIKVVPSFSEQIRFIVVGVFVSALSLTTSAYASVITGSFTAGDFSPWILQGGRDVTNVGAFIRYDFTAADTTLNIAFGGIASDFTDNNPILNALTLENTTSIPEPTSLAMLGLGLLALRRFKRR